MSSPRARARACACQGKEEIVVFKKRNVLALFGPSNNLRPTRFFSQSESEQKDLADEFSRFGNYRHLAIGIVFVVPTSLAVQQLFECLPATTDSSTDSG